MMGIGACAFYTRDDVKPTLNTLIEPILYLSRSLTIAKKNYWPIELKVATLV